MSEGQRPPRSGITISFMSLGQRLAPAVKDRQWLDALHMIADSTKSDYTHKHAVLLPALCLNAAHSTWTNGAGSKIVDPVARVRTATLVKTAADEFAKLAAPVRDDFEKSAALNLTSQQLGALATAIRDNEADMPPIRPEPGVVGGPRTWDQVREVWSKQLRAGEAGAGELAETFAKTVVDGLQHFDETVGIEPATRNAGKSGPDPQGL